MPTEVERWVLLALAIFTVQIVKKSKYIANYLYYSRVRRLKSIKNDQKLCFEGLINPIWVYCALESSPEHFDHPGLIFLADTVISWISQDIQDIQDISKHSKTMQIQEATVSLWGKSTAIRIPAMIVKKSALRIGQSVQVENMSDGSITIRPVVERPKLETLLAGVTRDNMPDEADISWGKPRGTEAW